jgi:rhodanese-related sulfurtransferase
MIRPIALLILIVSLTTPLPAADPAPVPAAAPVSAPKNISVDDADKLLKSDPKVVVIDVRTADEFKGGHIRGAVNIDFFGDDFAKQLGALDKSKTYLVHCAAGGRSGKACKVIEQQQLLPSVYHLNEGFKEWEKAGKPVEK